MRRHIGIGLSLLLSGCVGLTGPSSLVTPKGVVVAKDEKDKCPSAVLDTSINTLFHNALCASAKAPTDVGAARQMLTTGFALAKLRCDDFFWAKSRNQTGTRVGRSALAPLVSVTSGVLALLSNNPEHLQDYLKYLALGSAAVSATIDIYEEHFLFGADNIDAVRSLTMDALSEHRLAVLKADPRDFQSVLMQLTDHQALCRPVHILALTRDAIKVGTVKARINPAIAPAVAQSNSDILIALGTDYNRPPVTLDEAGYLWWLHRSQPVGTAMPQNELAIIFAYFDALKWGANNPVTNTAGTYATTSVATVDQDLQKLASDLVIRFGDEVRSIRAKNLVAPAANPADAIRGIAFQPADLESFRSIDVGVVANK